MREVVVAVEISLQHLLTYVFITGVAVISCYITYNKALLEIIVLPNLSIVLLKLVIMFVDCWKDL